jgi:hypothetical protein
MAKSQPWPKPGSWFQCHAELLRTRRPFFLRRTASLPQPGPLVAVAYRGSNRSQNHSWQPNTNGRLTSTSQTPLPVLDGFCEYQTVLCRQTESQQLDRGRAAFLRNALERTLLNPRAPRMGLSSSCTDRRIGLPLALTSVGRAGKPSSASLRVCRASGTSSRRKSDFGIGLSRSWAPVSLSSTMSLRLDWLRA